MAAFEHTFRNNNNTFKRFNKTVVESSVVNVLSRSGPSVVQDCVVHLKKKSKCLTLT